MKPNKSHQKRMQELEEDLQFNSMKSNINRARSITVGTAFGGIIEISLRTDTDFFYAQLQPTEAVEIIEQLASACGLQIALRPKQDFSAWRGWELTEESDVRVIWKGGSPWQLHQAEDIIKNEGQNLLENLLSSGKEDTDENLEENNTEE